MPYPRMVVPGSMPRMIRSFALTSKSFLFFGANVRGIFFIRLNHHCLSVLPLQGSGLDWAMEKGADATACGQYSGRFHHYSISK